MSLDIEGDMDFARSLTQCQSVADLATLQQKWAATAVQDYGGEASRLMQIATRAVNEGAPEQRVATGCSD